MPPRQVYGKRKEIGGYDPNDFFGKIQQESSPDVKVAEIVEEFSRLGVQNDEASKAVHRVKGRQSERDRRDIFAEVDRNVRTLSALSLNGEEKKTKKTVRRPRRKVVVEDSESENDTSSIKEYPRGPVAIATRAGSDERGIDRMNSFDGEMETAPVSVRSSKKTPSTNTLERRRNGSKLSSSDAVDTEALPSTAPLRNIYHHHCAQLLELSSHRLTDFTEWSDQLCQHLSITKIAEASFGEVYRLSLKKRLSGFSSSDESVFKIIALRPPVRIEPLDRRKKSTVSRNVANMSSPEDVANEVKLLQRMSSIPGFTNFRDVRIVQGRPPQAFQKAYKDFNTAQKARKKDLSHFPDPVKKTSYAEDQLWAVIEMQDAGMDLERLVEAGQCSSIFFVWDVFWQVVLSLAKGEEGAEFEHRDLHLGNICVRQGEPAAQEGVQGLDAKHMKLGFTDAETTIIDYTISRALMPDESIAYHDLAADPGLFEGDSTDEYQYDIYRYMRGVVMFDDAYADPSHTSLEDRSWRQHHPDTNLVWLHFVLYKLLEALDWPSARKAPPRRKKEEYAKWKRASDLEHVLLRVQELLDPGMLGGDDCGELRAASDLVGLALREGWLEVGDVVGEVEEDKADDLVSRLEDLALNTGCKEAVV